LTSASKQRELYLIALHPFFFVGDSLEGIINNAL
jgi:hypothetical protein